MTKKSGLKIILLLIIISSILMFFLFDLNNYISLPNLKNGLAGLKAFYAENRMLTMVIYFIIYLLISALSLPVAGITTLTGGALFGLFYGTILASFASTMGGTLAFLFSRYMFRDWVQNRFPSKLSIINRGIEKEGGFYLFTIRLIAIFPFFVVNLAMGLTNI
ncbi:MAG: TVP38/TMEM64 family protein, partial [Desulfobacteraceae bacterium]|nr:TVP38/TMEM64 family protein [Desulfobacteraceae bacterium]